MKGRMIGLAVFAVACALSSGIATSDEDAGAAPDITLDRVLREHPDLRGAYETLRATPSAATANTDPFEVAMARLLEISGERREEAAVLVATFLDNENWGIRQDAVGALGGLRVASYIPEVVKRLDDTELGVRLAAIGACAELGAKSAIPRIARFLAEEPGESIYACPRFYAAAALAQLIEAPWLSGLDPFEEASAWWKANRDREDFTDYTLPEEERTREPATRVLAPPERDTWRGSRRFTFPNFVTVEVRSAAEASFTVEHLREGFFQAPVDRLTVRSSGGEFTISDIGMSDRGVKVNGREFRVPMTHLLVINETGGIDVIPLPEGEAPTGLIPMTTPR